MPDFTIEKLHNLNTQLLAIISENDSICSVFTRLQEQHQSTSSAPSSESPGQVNVLVAAIQEIQLDGDGIPNPKKHVLKNLDLISQANLSNEYSKGVDTSKEEVNLLSWVLAAKSTAVLYAIVLERLLNATLPLSKDIIYWEELQGSTLRETYHIIQTMPSRIYSLTTATVRSINAHTQTISLTSPRQFITTVSEASRSNILHLFPAYLHSRLSTRRLYIPSMIHFEIKSKSHRLRSLRKYQAACLGLLMDRGLDFSGQDGETAQNVLQRQISRALELMERVLKQLRDVEAEHQMNIPDIFSQSLPNLSLRETHDSIAKLFNQFLPDLTAHSQKIGDLYGRPGIVTRYWPVVVGGYFLASESIKWISNNRESIERWVSEAKSTAKDFLWNWIWEPMKKVWETVRMENREYRILGKESLESDLESLERMVIDFGRKNSKLSPPELEELRKQVRAGDLGQVLRVYENEIKQPVKNAVAGNLIRALLIQVQKSKVDVDLSLAALDKLLKSNELNFAFLAVGPSLVLLWLVARQLRYVIGRRSGAQLALVVEPIRSSLRDIEQLLNVADKSPDYSHTLSPTNPLPQNLPFQEQGLIFCEAHLLRTYAKTLPVHNNIREKFMEDLRELESAKLSIRQRLGTVRRMWRTWGFLSKRGESELDV